MTRQPASMLEAIYAFIGAAPFAHDFDNVEYAAHEFDLVFCVPGLHTVARCIGFTPRHSILPPELFHRFEDDAFWLDPGLIRHLRVLRQPG